MTHGDTPGFALRVCLILSLGSLKGLSATETNIEDRLRALEEQNQVLQSQLRKQQNTIDALTHDLTSIRAANSNQQSEMDEVKADLDHPTESSASDSHLKFGNVHLSGEGGIAFFNTGSDGFAPHSDFRVDEARLFLESPVWDEVYFFGEADFATRENTDFNVKVGELYLDWEDVSRIWGHDRQLNLRVGRMNIPFGEEYLTRYAIDNPLISHSLSDLWGFDSGVELYGSAGKFSYVAAVQDGGGNNVPQFSGDKSVAGRLSYDPARWLHFSASGMRTGDRNPHGDFVSALWFGSGFFRSLGSPATTSFHANLVEGDAAVQWSSGHLKGFGGYARYGDNDPAADNGRNIFYYSVEGVQQISQKFYGAARFSEIIAPDGFPIVGNGDFNTYFFNNLSTRLWRLSLGLGYRFSDRLIVKTEYSLERGEETSGNSRDHEDFIGAESAFAF